MNTKTNTRALALSLSIASIPTLSVTLSGCGGDVVGSDTAPVVVDDSGRRWMNLGDAPISHRPAQEVLDPGVIDRASRLRDIVARGGTLLDEGSGRELYAPRDAARVARAVADYDRARPAEAAPAVADRRIAPPPGAAPNDAARNIQGFSDGRTRVSTGSLGNRPYEYIGRYTIPMGGNTISVCSGTLIGSNYVALAAHCVYDRHDDAWIYGPNGERGTFCVNNVCGNVTGRKMNANWSSASDLHFREHDYAMLRLDTALGTTNGVMGLSSITSDSTVKDLDARNHGYPTVTPDGSTASGTNLWGMHCDIVAAYSDRLAYNCDTTGGHSGGPVYYYNSTNAAYYMLAVHSGPNTFDNTGARVSAVRTWFTSEMVGW